MLPAKIIKCPNHKRIKDKILKYMEEHPGGYFIEHSDDPRGTGPYTDWDENNEADAKYWLLYKKYAEKAIIDVVRNEFLLENAELSNYWFQQYTKNLQHGWHHHYGCLYHAIYYCELPEGTPPTMVRLPGGFEFTPNVKEGDILIMPSIYMHTSPINKSDKRKTIIAVNIDEEEWCEDEED